MFDFSKLSRRSTFKTFQKTSQDCLETETFKAETTSLLIPFLAITTFTIHHTRKTIYVTIRKGLKSLGSRDSVDQ